MFAICVLFKIDIFYYTNRQVNTHIDLFSDSSVFQMEDTPKYFVMNPLFVERRKTYTDRFYDSLRKKARFLKSIRDLYRK